MKLLLANGAAWSGTVAEQNVRRMMKRIRQDSPTLRDLEAQGRMRIAGGMYDMDGGEVTLLE